MTGTHDACRNARTLVALLIAAWVSSSVADDIHPDFRTFFGIARGSGEVRLSPSRGFHFSSRHSRDLAFAQTSAALPMAYRVTLDIESIDIRRAGCSLGIFDGAARFGGDNSSMNALMKCSVCFHEWRDKRFIYLWYFDPAGEYHCWTGSRWTDNTWQSTGKPWEAKGAYGLVIEKTLTEFSLEVRQSGKTLAKTPGVPVAGVRGSGTGDYLVFGDTVNNYVEGELSISAANIEETVMAPHVDADMEHVIIREAPEGRYAMYGGLTLMPDGEVFCTYKVGSVDAEGSPWTVRDETIVWTRSTDKGRTWPGTENLIYKDGTTRQEACCGKGHRSKSGKIMQPFYILNADFEERAKGDNWGKLNLAVTADEGKTWEIREVKTPFASAASFGGIVPLRDGRQLLNTYGAVEVGSFRHEAGFLVSDDDGETWSDYHLIGEDADPDGGPARLNETDIIQLPNGKLLTMSRTQYDAFPLYRGVSTDEGRTWTVGPSQLTGLCPCMLYTSDGPPEGTVVIAYHDRWGKHAGKGGIYLAFSQNGGATWGEPMWVSGGAYPCMIQTADGSILCSYYQTNQILRGTYFTVPFPSGLRASGGIPDTDTPGIRVQWDEYHGEAAGEVSYRVYRGTTQDFQPGPQNLITTVTNTARHDDTDVATGDAFYYRVGAYIGEKRLGTSWIAVARAGG